MSAVSITSLIPKGTPCKGLRGDTRSSARACASASSWSRNSHACTSRSRAVMRSRQELTSASLLSSLDAMRRAASAAERSQAELMRLASYSGRTGPCIFSENSIMLKAALRGDPLMEFVLPQPRPGSIAAYIAALCALVVFAMPASAQQSAQQYPNKPIRVIVAFGAGGIADTIARLIGQKLSERYGQQIVVDNRPGAGGTLGARLVAGANPDGYTLLVI